MTTVDRPDEAAAMQARILAALDEVEREEGVRILLAVESGSRAWGFPSRDSDWDVRFLYLRPLPAYLTVEPSRDVIERPLLDGLDLGGWDLRKALGLLTGSNAVVLEWLCSPIRYRADARAVAALSEVARQTAHLPALEYHYDRLARRSWQLGEAGSGSEEVRLKSLFYALRPALALAWMRRHGTPPPMDLPTLLAGLALPDAVLGAIEVLRARKAEAKEEDAGPCPPAIEVFLAETLSVAVTRPPPWDRSAAVAAADALLLHLLNVNPGQRPVE